LLRSDGHARILHEALEVQQQKAASTGEFHERWRIGEFLSQATTRLAFSGANADTSRDQPLACSRSVMTGAAVE